jgi:hypothetical protein
MGPTILYSQPLNVNTGQILLIGLACFLKGGPQNLPIRQGKMGLNINNGFGPQCYKRASYFYFQPVNIPIGPPFFISRPF